MSGSVKLVWFVPPAAAQATREVVFAAGGGRVGGYSRCSWSTVGEGTFSGDEGTSPATGQPGQDMRAPQVRIETVVPVELLQNVLDALRGAHPYEEPSFDVYARVDT